MDAEPFPVPDFAGTDPTYGHAGLPHSTQIGLAVLYLLVLLLNLGFAAYLFYVAKDRTQALIWAVVGGVFLVHAILYLSGHGPILSLGFKNTVDTLTNPVSYFLGGTAAFAAFLYFRRFFTLPAVAFAGLNLFLLASGWAMTDKSFREIITKEDNVPIVLLIFAVGFFTWLAMRQAVLNDAAIDRGEPPAEKLEDEKVLVWPDLVYTELIAMVLCTFALIIWAVLLKAPLEQPATTAKAPNPSKAPWYFLGLQEMLVYYDPWMAGVVLPLMIINGLVAIPYIDFNAKGNGYYTFKQRIFAITTFLYGFDVLWVTLIVLGTFLRGPNWNFFGPFEPWDPHKVLPLNNVNLSQLFWLGLMNQDPEGKFWLIREMPGILLVAAYMLLLPPLLGKTILRSFFIKMGFIRFFVLVNLIQFMACLPLKMILRWTLNLKYIVYIPEYFFNIWRGKPTGRDLWAS